MKNTMMLTLKDFKEMTIYRLRRDEPAYRFSDRAIKAMMVILGDDERYWVVTMADAERLLRAGYEVAPRVAHNHINCD
jgi:hypothetical protein